MPSNFINEGNFNFKDAPVTQAEDNNLKEIKEDKEIPKKSTLEKNNAQMSWLSLFAELDPLANQDIANADGDRA